MKRRRQWYPVGYRCPKCGAKMTCQKSKPIPSYKGSNDATMIQSLKCEACKVHFKHTVQVFREESTL